MSDGLSPSQTGLLQCVCCKSMEIERESGGEIGWWWVGTTCTAWPERAPREWTRNRKIERKKKRKKERNVFLCVWTYADNIHNIYTCNISKPVYTCCCCCCWGGGSWEWRDALANHVESSGSHQIPPSIHFSSSSSPLGFYTTVARISNN